MKPEKKVPSRELCQRLWELGITKDIKTYWAWAYRYGEFNATRDWILVKTSNFPKAKFNNNYFPAPDLSELGELLPDYFGEYNRTLTIEPKYTANSGRVGWIIYFDSKDVVFGDTEPNARAEMAIALFEVSI